MACGVTPSAGSTTSGDSGVGSFLPFPSTSPGAPNAPMSVYRDDADGVDEPRGFGSVQPDLSRHNH